MKPIRNSPHTAPSLATMLCLVWSWCAFTSSYAKAETLENVLESKAMQDFKLSGTENLRRDKKDVQLNQWLRGIDPNSTLATIWTSSNAPQLLLNWAGAKLPYMHYKRPRSSRSRDVVSAEVDLSTSQRDLAHLLIMVPHPAIAPLVEGNVLEEFRRLRPPILPVASEKPIPLAVGQGTLYELKNGAGALVIPLSQNGLINITISDFKRSQFLIDIAKGLDIERLNRKLDS
jgi:hypothetical protein